MTERTRTAEEVAASLGLTPGIKVVSVIEVTFLRGAGVAPDDPVRLVTAYFRAEDGSPIAEIDPYAEDS